MQISVVQISEMPNYPQDNPLLKQKTHLRGTIRKEGAHCMKVKTKF